MFRVRFSEAALVTIVTYINNYREGYRELFSNTGIWAEQAILRQHEKSAEKLFNGLLETTNNLLTAERVLGRKKSGKFIEIHFSLADRHIIVYFTEDRVRKERTVELVNMKRKSILF